MNLRIQRSGRELEGRRGRKRYPAGLTERQVEVLHLVAAGKSNPVIADQLVSSLNTVTNHITNIFTKIGASNRAQAAVYAVRSDLTE